MLKIIGGVIGKLDTSCQRRLRRVIEYFCRIGELLGTPRDAWFSTLFAIYLVKEPLYDGIYSKSRSLYQQALLQGNYACARSTFIYILFYQITSLQECLEIQGLCHNCWVPSTDYTGAILAALGFSCIYIDQVPLISRNQTILLAKLRVRLSVCDIRTGAVI